ncbi:hypothetical protein AAFF_G00365760 [Aldrovandia affinis]|uniref:Uncharacterized protein n=1 Tax=Aldrovandia affinis TaxID=143900 RepID=A0AAD7WMS9_9TELE|nr:hypothetical protein AAFF_G00365760 [Aldrovandia affinis]
MRDHLKAQRRNLSMGCLKERFNEKDVGVIKAARILDFTSWPSSENSSDFGDHNIQAVTDHFQNTLPGSGINAAEVEREWNAFKVRMYDEMPVETINKLNLVELDRYYAATFPSIVAVFDLIATLPAASAEVERGLVR